MLRSSAAMHCFVSGMGNTRLLFHSFGNPASCHPLACDNVTTNHGPNLASRTWDHEEEDRKPAKRPPRGHRHRGLPTVGPTTFVPLKRIHLHPHFSVFSLAGQLLKLPITSDHWDTAGNLPCPHKLRSVPFSRDVWGSQSVRTVR